jgi:hypothetical protein
MIEKEKILNALVLDFGFEHFGLFRISSFGFRVLIRDCLACWRDQKIQSFSRSPLGRVDGGVGLVYI